MSSQPSDELVVVEDMVYRLIPVVKLATSGGVLFLTAMESAMLFGRLLNNLPGRCGQYELDIEARTITRLHGGRFVLRLTERQLQQLIRLAPARAHPPETPRSTHGADATGKWREVKALPDIGDYHSGPSA